MPTYAELLNLYQQGEDEYMRSLGGGAAEMYNPNHGVNSALGGLMRGADGSIAVKSNQIQPGQAYQRYYADGRMEEDQQQQPKDGWFQKLGQLTETAVPLMIAAGGAYVGGGLAGLYGAPGAAATSGSSVLSGAATGGGMTADTIAAAVAEASAGTGGYLLPGYEAMASAGAAANGAAAGGMWDTVSNLGGKAVDALGTKGLGALAGAAAGAIGGTSKAGDQTVTTRQEIDPRMAQILYGSQGNNGFLSQITGSLNTPQAAGMQNFGSGMDSYLGNWGTDNFMRSQQAAQRLQSSNINAPTMSAASVANVPGMNAAQVQAPSQNNLNLQPAYQDMVYGQAGNNPYLTGAIGKGINQSNNAFGNYLTDATKSTQDMLGSIRGGAIINGAMGSSRQGIAEGNAMNDFTKNITRAATQFGQNNTDAAVAAQAGAYDADRNRALSAMSGLGAQQYGVAQQNAQMQQQANQTNYQGGLQTALTNAGFQQQANANNQSSQLGTNQLNSANQLGGINASSGLLNSAYNMGTNQDSYNLNKVGKVGGLLAPFTGLGGSSTQTQPLYENKTNSILGGALMGSQMLGGFGKLFS